MDHARLQTAATHLATLTTRYVSSGSCHDSMTFGSERAAASRASSVTKPDIAAHT